MADYRLTSTLPSFPSSAPSTVPPLLTRPPNIHWQEYSNWLAMGNVPDPYTADISNRQFYHQLTVSGRLTHRWNRRAHRHERIAEENAHAGRGRSRSSRAINSVTKWHFSPLNSSATRMPSRRCESISTCRRNTWIRSSWMRPCWKNEQPHGLVQGQPGSGDRPHNTSPDFWRLYRLARGKNLNFGNEGISAFGSDR